ncbi:unnamed protein product [Allacma fusca]|uniref:TNFR-Cys domain-containing protein n=1 Tax=Allacma fusca TaxID=39272 RepID=A0A8J2KTQ8_9HEXA|nr:unnamed protein product [Allacma fusca]
MMSLISSGVNPMKPKGLLLSIGLILTGFLLSMECAPFGGTVDTGTTTPRFKRCTNDGDCSSGHFCYTRRLDPICQKCHKCSLHHRVSKYPCAKSMQECGECLPGYEERKHAISMFECVELTPAQPAPGDCGNNKTNSPECNNSSMQTSPWIWATTVVALSLVTVTAISLTVFIRRRRPPSRGDGFEKVELMSPVPSAPPPDANNIGQSSGPLSSGKPSEFDPPPPSNPHFRSDRNLAKCVENSYQQANPYALGTSSGLEAELYLYNQGPEVEDGIQPNDEVAELFEQAMAPAPAQPNAEVPEGENLNEVSIELPPWDEDNFDVDMEADIDEILEPQDEPHEEPQDEPEFVVDIRVGLFIRVESTMPSTRYEASSEQVVPDMDLNNNEDQTSESSPLIDAQNNVQLEDAYRQEQIAIEASFEDFPCS